MIILDSHLLRPPIMPDWGNWSPDLWKLATVSLFLADSRTNLRAGWWCDIWISRGWQGYRLWIRGGLIWALSVLSLDSLRQETIFLLPLPSQVFDFVFNGGILQGAKLWWTTYSILSWWGGETPLVFHAPGMKISFCCGGPLTCFKYLYVLLECWVKKANFLFLSPHRSLILCLLVVYCREQSCDGLDVASHPGGGGGWWGGGVKLPRASCTWNKYNLLLWGPIGLF